MPIYVSYAVYHALTLAALYPTTTDETARAQYLATMTTYEGWLVDWAKACPANFADKRDLVKAEIARAKGDVASALGLYEKARHAARAQGFVQYEALACELAASAYRTLGVATVERALLTDAYTLYLQWGAGEKRQTS